MIIHFQLTNHQSFPMKKHVLVCEKHKSNTQGQETFECTSINIKYRHNSLSNTKSYKYLGINLDQSFSLTEHFTSTFKKASGRLYLLKRVRHHPTKQAALAIHRTLITPMFNY